MNDHDRQPPDEHKTSLGPAHNDSIFCEMKIKQEPIVKQEDDDAIWMVSRSSHTISGVVLDTLTDDVQVDVADDFDGDLIGAKSEVKVEKDKEVANSATRKSPTKGKTSKYNAEKRFVKNKMQKSIGLNVAKKKRASNAGKKPKSNIFVRKNNSSTKKANQKRHKCSLCDYVTHNKTNLRIHMFKHTGEKPISCTVCPKRFAQRCDLQRHMKVHVDEFLFSCSTCFQGFYHKEEKVEHEAGCKLRRYECHLCKEYSTLIKMDLEKHMRVHTGEKPFGCENCSKKFALANNLKRHRKTHTNPRPLKFKCSVCFKNFDQQMEMENHEANCTRRGYKCDVCKSYTTNVKSILDDHMRIHTGKKPFRCEICSKFFTQRGHLNRHKKIHK